MLPSYADREELGEIQADASVSVQPRPARAARAVEELAAELSGIAGAVERNEEEKGISLRELSRALNGASRRDRRTPTARCATSGSSACSAPSAPRSRRARTRAYMRRLSPLEATYTKERATAGLPRRRCSRLGFDLAAQPNIKLDLDDRPQKSPRACVIASDPPTVVHLITRAQGGLHDYQAFLHEAGPRAPLRRLRPVAAVHLPPHLARPRADRDLLLHRRGDLARAGWHARYFGLSDAEARENAEATLFLEALLFRRYEAKLRFELDFWSRFADDGGTPEGYAERLTERDRHPLPQRRLPRRHGRRLLLGRLPARLDPLGAAPPVPDRRGRRGLVAQPADRRAAPRRSSARARSRRARRSPAGSASTRSTPAPLVAETRRGVRLSRGGLRLHCAGSSGPFV